MLNSILLCGSSYNKYKKVSFVLFAIMILRLLYIQTNQVIDLFTITNVIILAGVPLLINRVKNENAKKVFDMSIGKTKQLDYSKLRTIEYAHKGSDFEKIYENASDFLIEEKRICLEDAREYDCLSITISGDKLLEEFENEETI